MEDNELAISQNTELQSKDYTNNVDKVCNKIDGLSQSATELSNSVNNLANSMENYTNTMHSIATQVIAYKARSTEIEARLKEISLTNKDNLKLMKTQYYIVKPEIDDLHKTISSLMDQLKQFDIKNMDEEQTKTYRGLLAIITHNRDKIFSFYDRIL